MKLFYITRVSIPSGAAQSVQITSMCEAFNNEKIVFKLISSLTEENIKLKKDFTWHKIKLSKRLRYLKFVFKSFLVVLREKPSHIYSRDIVVAFSLSFLKIKVIYEAHKEPRTKTASLMLKFLKNKENFLLVTISKSLKNYYLKDYNFMDKKVFDYHDAVFIEKYDFLRDVSKSSLRKELGLPNDRTVIMHTGSLYFGRGAEHFETIIEHFKNILFIQVGGTVENIKEWKNYYKKYENILFIDHQDNDMLIKYQMSADLLFYPMTKKTQTYWCCSPMKIFEYMATGVPILSSNVGSVSEVLCENNSIPFNPNNKQSIIDGVNLFLKNKEIVEMKSKKALNEVRKKFTWQKRVNAIIKFMKD